MKKTLRKIGPKKRTLRPNSPRVLFEAKYAISDVVLGQGSFAVVRGGIERETNRNVAIKLIEKEGMSEMEATGVKREIEILSSLQHRNIVRLYDWYETDVQFIIVMEFVGGGMLYDKISNQNVVFSENDVRNIIVTIVSALNYCKEKGIVHRDIKPKNILYDADGTTLKIVDFNLSTKLSPAEIQELQLQTRCGTPHYVAPEVVLGTNYNFKCDIWSLGCIVFILASGGYQPFSSSEQSSESEINDVLQQVEAGIWAFQPAHAWDKVSHELKDLIKGMLCKDPAKRLDYQQILHHPWMQKGELSANEINLAKLQEGLKSRLDNTAKVVNAAAAFGELMGSADASMVNFGASIDLGASGNI